MTIELTDDQTAALMRGERVRLTVDMPGKAPSGCIPVLMVRAGARAAREAGTGFDDPSLSSEEREEMIREWDAWVEFARPSMEKWAAENPY